MSIFSSIRKIFWPTKEVNDTPQSFQPQRYWEARHQQFRNRLQAVGHLQLSHLENAKQYEVKRQHIVEMIDRYVPETKNRKLLDAGCGIGVFTKTFVEKGFDVTAIDLSTSAIKHARSAVPQARYIVTPLSTLQLNEGFDVIAVIDVLLHVVDDRLWRATLASLAGHLYSGGRLLILDHLQKALPDHPPHVKTRSLAQYKAMFVNLGMNMIDHKRFRLEQEDSWKDLIVVEFSKDIPE